VTFFSSWASYTKTVARNPPRLVNEWLAVLRLARLGLRAFLVFLGFSANWFTNQLVFSLSALSGCRACFHPVLQLANAAGIW
jgi:hypothetical protein